MQRLLRARAGFTLVEVVIALALTAVVGATISGVFVSQTRFFDRQEKVGSARGVARGALNMMLSEMRMIDRTWGIISATGQRVTLRVPYAMGMSCGTSGGKLVVSRLPADPSVITDSSYSGYAYRTAAGTFARQEGFPRPNIAASTAHCVTASVTIAADGQVLEMMPGSTAAAGQPVFLYQIITYEFKASTSVPGHTGLFRTMQTKKSGTIIAPLEEELVAPLDAGAKFRFYVNDAATAQTAVPASLSTITGLELTLDAVSERPDLNGTHQRAPLTTSIFFRNR